MHKPLNTSLRCQIKDFSLFQLAQANNLIFSLWEILPKRPVGSCMTCCDWGIISYRASKELTSGSNRQALRRNSNFQRVWWFLIVKRLPPTSDLRAVTLEAQTEYAATPELSQTALPNIGSNFGLQMETQDICNLYLEAKIHWNYYTMLLMLMRREHQGSLQQPTTHKTSLPICSLWPPGSIFLFRAPPSHGNNF